MQKFFLLLFFLCVSSPSHGIEFLPDPVTMFEPHGNVIQKFEKRRYQSATGSAALNYFLLKPANYDPSKSYPLVVSLHSASGHSYAAHLLAAPQMQYYYPAFVLVPQVETRGWSWPIYNDTKKTPIEHVMSIIIDLGGEFSIDKSRIYLTGYSMGGYGTFIMLAKYPGFFAAAAPLCGNGDTMQAAKMTDTPLWVFHGSDDPYTPAAESRKIVAAIRQAGGKPFYTEYPGVGHDVWNYAYAEPKFWAWLFAQKRR